MAAQRKAGNSERHASAHRDGVGCVEHSIAERAEVIECALDSRSCAPGWKERPGEISWNQSRSHNIASVACKARNVAECRNAGWQESCNRSPGGSGCRNVVA